MPYSSEHKQKTRARIVESARILFNRHGFEKVSIDMVMAHADLTRGGFYNHFKSKEELFAAAVSSFLMGRGAQWRAAAGIDPDNPAPEMASQMIAGYLSPEHLGDLDGQCPMIALPSDVARSNPEVRAAWCLPRFASVAWCWRERCRTRHSQRKFAKRLIRRLSVSPERQCSCRTHDRTFPRPDVLDQAGIAMALMIACSSRGK